MKEIRIVYKKLGNAKFISHLDTNRLMTRLIRMANIPIWYTEGFNPHAYINFALPLSLGTESKYEIMDIRLLDDEFSLVEVKNRLVKVFPSDFPIIDVCEPKDKYSKIAAAEYCVEFYSNDIELAQKLNCFLDREHIFCEKKNKKKQIVSVDVADKIIEKHIKTDLDCLTLDIILPAGNNDNINPSLIINSFFSEYNKEAPPISITRTGILNDKKELLK